MLTNMIDADWVTVLKVFEASRSRRGDKGRDDRSSYQHSTTSRSTTSLGGRFLPSSVTGTAFGSGFGD